MTEVYVVRGMVEAVRDGSIGGAPVRERLVAGEAIRFASLKAPPERMMIQALHGTAVPLANHLLHKVREARRSLLLIPVGLVATAYHRVWVLTAGCWPRTTGSRHFGWSPTGYSGAAKMMCRPEAVSILSMPAARRRILPACCTAAACVLIGSSCSSDGRWATEATGLGCPGFSS